MEENENVVEDDDSLPMKHQFGMLVVGTIVGFVAQQLSQVGYEAVRKALKNRQTTVQ